MAIILGKVKCHFCKGYMGILHSVHGYGVYANEIEKRVYYHPEYIELIQMYPESHLSIDVDMALWIIERKKENQKTNDDIIPNYEKKCEKLKLSHFENMMPSK